MAEVYVSYDDILAAAQGDYRALAKLADICPLIPEGDLAHAVQVVWDMIVMGPIIYICDEE